MGFVELLKEDFVKGELYIDTRDAITSCRLYHVALLSTMNTSFKPPNWIPALLRQARVKLVRRS